MRTIPYWRLVLVLAGELLLAFPVAAWLGFWLEPYGQLLEYIGGFAALVYINLNYVLWHRKIHPPYTVHLIGHAFSHLLTIGLAITLPPIPLPWLFFVVGLVMISPGVLALFRKEPLVQHQA